MVLRTNELRSLLSGGDRRSLAGAADVLAAVRADPRLLSGLVALAEDVDPLVVMRALDVLEKLAQEDPHRLAPHKRVFIGAGADHPMWEMHLQIVRALPLFAWTGKERDRVLSILRRDAGHQNRMVRAWAVDSLSQFAVADPSLRPEVEALVADFERGPPGLRARARHIRQRLGLAPATAGEAARR